ncbi:MAG: hypothetical protein Q8T08_18860, partial [Ignavibacteria bacterium]|nr:hypothetical protein [Ignavibacteria bacterium]
CPTTWIFNLPKEVEKVSEVCDCPKDVMIENNPRSIKNAMFFMCKCLNERLKNNKSLLTRAGKDLLIILLEKKAGLLNPL